MRGTTTEKVCSASEEVVIVGHSAGKERLVKETARSGGRGAGEEWPSLRTLAGGYLKC